MSTFFLRSTSIKLSVFTLAAAGLYAQTTTPPTTSPVSSPAITTYTTGIIGVAEGQQARFNVLNPGIAPPATGAVCTAQISIVGDDGKTIKTAMVSLIPGTAAGLALDGDIELKLVGAERREVRATITSSCKLIGTVEIFDRFSGRTQANLGGMHALGSVTASATGN